jgi:hypothetical protein
LFLAIDLDLLTSPSWWSEPGGSYSFHSARFSDISKAMPSSISDIKKRRGRPPKAGGIDPGVFVRLPTNVLMRLDAWATKQDVTRSEAIRQLIEAGLKRRPKQ